MIEPDWRRSPVLGRHEALPSHEEQVPLPHRQHRQAVGPGWRGGEGHVSMHEGPMLGHVPCVRSVLFTPDVMAIPSAQ